MQLITKEATEEAVGNTHSHSRTIAHFTLSFELHRSVKTFPTSARRCSFSSRRSTKQRRRRMDSSSRAQASTQTTRKRRVGESYHVCFCQPLFSNAFKHSLSFSFFPYFSLPYQRPRINHYLPILSDTHSPFFLHSFVLPCLSSGRESHSERVGRAVVVGATHVQRSKDQVRAQGQGVYCSCASLVCVLYVLCDINTNIFVYQCKLFL
jgi:hypothetical protein